MNAIPLPNFEPGSEEWQKRMTASKVAAVLGLSPWESRFSLWHRMAGLVEQTPDTDQTRRGHYLEDGVARWFADQHPEFHQMNGGAWAHPERPWQAASPDRRLLPQWIYEHPTELFIPTALLEIKTSAYADEWGEPGTDQVPPYYRAQVVWQLDTLGLRTAYVAVLFGQGLKFAEYCIDYNEAEAAYIRAEAKAFMDSLPGGPAEQRPDVDAHSQTYEVLRQINPDIDGDVQVDDDLAQLYIDAVLASRLAKKTEQYMTSRLTDYMGSAKRALWLGKPIASRQQRGGGNPYLVAARTFPVLDTTLEEIPA